jgi:hypothetical protein
MFPYYESQLKEDDVTLFLRGACHVFALALRSRFGYPLVILLNLSTKPPNGVSHVYCRYDKSEIVDVIGITPESNLSKAEGVESPKYRSVEISGLQLEPYFTVDPGGGLYADPEFLKAAEIRAKRRITQFEDNYSGKIRGPIPGSTRIQKASQTEQNQLFS